MSSFLDTLKEIGDKAQHLVQGHEGEHLIKQGLVGAFRSVKGGLDSDAQHDDPNEKKIDEIRKAICDSHPYQSFAAPRQHNFVKWYIDGHDYFWAVSEILDSAKECIFILDWWLSPELYLRRPPSDFPNWRLDRLLLKKAEQGVKVYIMVYKEVTQTMNMSSEHTKNALQALHPNIKVMRHPDHIGTTHDVEFWSHHEKLVIVDNHRACVGGLDLCFGRWDTHNHPLADAHPTDFSRTLFPGQDFNNGRVVDFQQVDNFVSNQVSILETARMPWHDVHMAIGGEAVLDLVQHFVERWNYVKKQKYGKDATYDWLAFPHHIARFPNEAVAQHPYRDAWDEYGTKFRNQWHELAAESGGLNALTPYQPPEGATADVYEEHQRTIRGTCNVQVLRSAADWSHGVLTEQSIQNAYIQLINEAEHFIYIENQFFISNATDKGPVKNKIAKALLERILRAAHAGQKFRVIVVIPEVPGFSGDIEKENSIQTIMAAQWRTINRGGNSIYELIQKAGFDPLNYIRVYHLRCYDRINAPASFIQEMAQNSGVSFFQAQIAQARVFIGDTDQWHQQSIKINAPAQYQADGDTTKDLGTTEKNGTSVIEEVKFPPSVSEAHETIKKYESGARRSDDDVSDTVGQHMLQDTTSLKDEKWLGSEQEERDCYVSELLYIHTKLMIVDDRRVIMGSANLNDRSQKGDGDSEIALVVEDQDMIETSMNGQSYTAARFAATLRRKIMREHLGLIPPQVCEDGKVDPVTAFMRSPPYPNDDETNTPEDQQVADPLSEDLWNLWNDTATKNRQIFDDVFRTVPTDSVRNWEQYKAYLPKVKTGHIASNAPFDQIKDQLSRVHGALVTSPLNFLIEEKSLTNDENPDWLGLNPTLPIYI